jgi:hypothetical protein
MAAASAFCLIALLTSLTTFNSTLHHNSSHLKYPTKTLEFSHRYTPLGIELIRIYSRFCFLVRNITTLPPILTRYFYLAFMITVYDQSLHHVFYLHRRPFDTYRREWCKSLREFHLPDRTLALEFSEHHQCTKFRLVHDYVNIKVKLLLSKW